MCFAGGKPQVKLSIVGRVVVQDTDPDGLEISATRDWRDLGDGFDQIIARLSGEGKSSVEVTTGHRFVPALSASPRSRGSHSYVPATLRGELEL